MPKPYCVQRLERTHYDFGPGAPFSQDTGYGRRVYFTSRTDPQRGTVELTQQEFEGLMKLAGFTPVEP